MSETASGGVRIVFEETEKFELDGGDADASAAISAKFGPVADSLADKLVPLVTEPFYEYYFRERSEDTDQQLDAVVDDMRQTLNLLRTLSPDEREQAYRNEASGLYVLLEPEPEDDTEENFEAVLSGVESSYEHRLSYVSIVVNLLKSHKNQDVANTYTMPRQICLGRYIKTILGKSLLPKMQWRR